MNKMHKPAKAVQSLASSTNNSIYPPTFGMLRTYTKVYWCHKEMRIETMVILEIAEISGGFEEDHDRS